MSEGVNPMSLSGEDKLPFTPEQGKALEYLRALDEQVYVDCLRQWGLLGLYDFEAFQNWDADECIACLQAFISTGLWPGYLFCSGKVWSIYLKSLAEERFHASLEYVCLVGTPADLMLYLRIAYKFGQHVIPDQEYDSIEKLYFATFPNISYLNNVVDDDLVAEATPVVNDAIRMAGVRSSQQNTAKVVPSTGSYAILNAEKSTSIMPLRSVEETYTWLKQAPAVATHWSLKVDGVNTKMLFKDNGGGIDVAVSRGRAADGWDYTEAVSMVVSYQGIDVSELAGRITGEGIVDPSALEMFRVKYAGKDYKSPKSTAGAMLRAPQFFDKEDYKYLHLYPFEIADTRKDIAFERLRKCGFAPPPDITIPDGGIPLDSIEGFEEWLTTTILDPLWEDGQKRNIGSDGVVLQLLTDVENDRADKYSDLNIALKFSHWTEAEYTSIVKDILCEQRRVEMSVVLEIEPVTTRDLNVATRVSVGSSAILVEDNVRVGDRIRFARKSEAINIYLGRA